MSMVDPYTNTVIPNPWRDEPMTKLIVTSWQKWFAWYPVKVHGEKVWMRTVYRRRSKIRTGPPGRVGPMYTAWTYGNIFDVLAK